MAASYLSHPDYKYDFAIATTQESINAVRTIRSDPPSISKKLTDRPTHPELDRILGYHPGARCRGLLRDERQRHV